MDFEKHAAWKRVQYGDNRKWHKYACITNNQPDTKSLS